MAESKIKHSKFYVIIILIKLLSSPNFRSHGLNVRILCDRPTNKLFYKLTENFNGHKFKF